MRFVELFAGIGGFSLGFERAGMECVGHVEIDPFARSVLRRHWPRVVIRGDVLKLKGGEFGKVHLICAGIPCQPFSVAGKRRGKDDYRDLWPEVFRVVKIERPRWFVGENVANFANMEFARTKSDLESVGYEVGEPLVVPACAVGLPHIRQRVWFFAHSASFAVSQAATPIRSVRSSRDTRKDAGSRAGSQVSEINWELSEADVCRKIDGVPSRLDRMRCLGNALVPQIAELIGRMIINADSSPA